MTQRLFDVAVAVRPGREVVTLPLSLALHGVVISLAIVFPLLGRIQLPEVTTAGVRLVFVEPQTIPVPPPPPAAVPGGGTRGPTQSGPTPPPASAGMTAPGRIPDAIIPDDAERPGGGSRQDGVEGGKLSLDQNSGYQPIVGGIRELVPERPPLKVGKDVTEPRKIHHVPPVYPPLALVAGVEGDVAVECVIGVDGHVRELTSVVGNPLLVAAATDAVRQWEYVPTLLDGKPFPVALKVTVQFRITRR